MTPPLRIEPATSRLLARCLNHLPHRVPQVILLQFIFQVATHRPYPEDGGLPYAPVDPVVYTLRIAEGPPTVPVSRTRTKLHYSDLLISNYLLRCPPTAVYGRCSIPVFLIHAVAKKKK